MSARDIAIAAGQFGIRLSETVVLGNRVLGLSSDGVLMQWHRGRWITLVFSKPSAGRPSRRSEPAPSIAPEPDPSTESVVAV